MSNKPQKKPQVLSEVRKPPQRAPSDRAQPGPVGKGSVTPDTCSSGPEIRDPPPEGTPD
jgi:hypothetical protein